ncbi:MAG: SUMF1/EgtB/PvdO family nonheme iron enzyme [Planctomycetota bacterium]
MADRIYNLRQDGQFDKALRLLQDNASRPKLLRRHILGRCLVLDWAVRKFQEGRRSECPTTIENLRNKLAPNLGVHQEQFESRLDLIHAASSPDADLDACRKAVARTAKATQIAWCYTPTEYVQAVQQQDFAATPEDSRNGPTFLWDLSDGYRQLFQEMAQTLGWLHPGLLLAGETLAQLEGAATKSDHRVKNYAMLANEAGEQSLGLLAPLTLSRVPSGRGFLIPDAYRSGYLCMQDSFSLGLQHAWQAWQIGLERASCDVRWSLGIEAAVKGTTLGSILGLPLSGRSAEGIFTCGLRATAAGEGLDRNTTMSASLALPIEPSLALEKVEDLDLKCLAPQYLDNNSQFGERLRRRKIRNVIISHRQPEEDYDTGGDQEFVPVRSIATAEEQFQLWPAITKHIKTALAKQAARHRINLCGPEPQSDDELRTNGRSYVQSPVAFLPIRQSGQEERAIRLDAEATRRFVLCDWLPEGCDPNASIRLRLLADSGMGKSVQLVACEEKIARHRSGMIPIRLGKSDTHRVRLQGTTTIQNIDWGQEDKQIFASLLDNCLSDAYPAAFKDRSLDWILRKAPNGEIVFLIDALDQTEGDLERLAKLLKRYPQCPVLASGRPETPHTRGSLFGQQDWHTLELQPLERPQQRELLGEHFGSNWVLEDGADEQPTAWTKDQDRRKYEVADLLSTPLLLQLLKKILKRNPNQNGQPEFRNRFELYALASRELLSKGLETAGKLDELSDDAANYLVALQKLALGMHRKHNFSQGLEGRDFEQWCTELAEAELKLKDLVQADLITMHGFLDRITLQDINDPVLQQRPGVEWRHLSFQEYFAAIELSRMWSGSKDERHEVADNLRDVHEVLEDEQIRTWPVWDDSKQQFVQQFRDLTASWRWTLRFLLCSLDENESRDSLALHLVQLGNPWIVYRSLAEDHLSLSQSVESLVRWLVHRDYTSDYDFRGALDLSAAARARDQARTSIQSANFNANLLVQRSTRDAAFLNPLRELGQDLNAYYRATSKESSLLERMTELRCGEATWNCLDSFVSVRGGQFDRSRYHPRLKFDDGATVQIEDFVLSDFPVTNALFELFAPTHRRWRDRYSNQDDQPAVNVSWYMADEFCQWLSTLCGESYRLPNEWEWEWACRWLGGREKEQRHDRYWWGPEINDALCWYGGIIGDGSAKDLQRTRTRAEAIAAFSAANKRHPSWRDENRPGLLDLSGNVWEWCANWHNSDASFRSLRGGSWYFSAGGCGSSDRSSNEPDYRDSYSGFRLLRE